MKRLAITLLLLAAPLTGCIVDDSNVGSDSGNATESSDPSTDRYLVEFGDSELRITERPDMLFVDVDGFRYQVPWDGQTMRCPCRNYRSSIFSIKVEHRADGPAISVDSARLGLTAAIAESSQYAGNYATVVYEPGATEPSKPTVADWLDLIDTLSNDELALLNRIAETDLAAYLKSQNPSGKVDLFWADQDELTQVTDMLNERIYAPRLASS